MRKRWPVILALISVCLLGAWAILHPQTVDPYPFLTNHQPADVSVLPPGTWGPREVRTYTWQETWQTIANRARHELPAFRLTQHRRRKNQAPGATWMSKETYGNGLEGISADVVIEIDPGRSQPKGSNASLPDNDPNWVTVTVISTLYDNWITVLRYTFLGMRD